MSEARVAMVTGATGAIGRAIAVGLASHSGWEVVLVVRDAGRGQRAASEVQRASGNGRVRFEVADLSRRTSVLALAERFAGPLHVLINDAAIAPRRREETPEGIELQLATNVLGYLWMAQGFEGALAAGARASKEPSRIVNVASYWAGDLDIDDLEFRRRCYDNDAAYRQSKQANRMLTVVQAEQLAEAGIVVNSCHPGDVKSKLSSDLGFGGHESPAEGARTPIWLATSSDVTRVSGRYFQSCKEERCHFASDRDAIERLAQQCAKLS